MKLLVLMVLSTQSVLSQDNHYWANQFGPTSTFLGGAVTGGVRDNSLLFYNPGAAAFATGFNLSLQSDAIYNQNIYVQNGAGEGLNVHHNRFETTPQIFSMTFGKEERSKWRTSVGWLTHAYSNIRLRARNEVIADVYSEYAGKENYVGTWNYRSRTREDWLGFALSRGIGKNLGLGISTFITSRSYEFVESVDHNILIDDSNNPGDLYSVRNLASSNNLDGAAVGVLWKFGLAYEIKDYKVGLTVTTPRLQLDWLASMTLNSSVYNVSDLPDSQSDLTNYSILFNKAKSTYKSPWIVDFGIMKNFFETDIYLRVGYFGSVGLYRMVEADETGPVTIKMLDKDDGTGIPFLAQKEVWNWAVGWNRMLTEKFGLMAGFRTDYNYLDREALAEINGFTPEISYWNLYHVSSGSEIVILKHKFTLGLTYTFGRRMNEAQFVNLDVPDLDSDLSDMQVENTANAYVDQVFLTIGYVYNF